MGWFLVTIVAPLAAPMVFMLLSRLLSLPATAAARTKLIILVQDGQLGWVALGFATACTYEVYTYVSKVGEKAVAWAHIALAIALITIVAAAYMAAVGALFPLDAASSRPRTRREWCRTYAAFLGTAIATAIAIVLYSLVHYKLPGVN
ncbi:hypothetical protein HSX11_26690 [Oxalobacteraceae bacterium]|nr:hypothetical protein [Oxalobacteraceae bacterium]